MEKISFNISARTAKLIGRENFSNPSGAIIELVKNGFDADAKTCVVIFNIVYPAVPNVVPKSTFQDLLSFNDLLGDAYKNTQAGYTLDAALSAEKEELLKQFFFRQNSIFIIDNGEGMNKQTLLKNWMEIGTANKDNEFVSAIGRIKTGAKGIGRFALDRLGYETELWSASKKTPEKTVLWKMNWRQFDNPSNTLTDVKAELEETNLTIHDTIQHAFSAHPALLQYLEKLKFISGTFIKISGLKDNWGDDDINTIFKSLEIMIPPKDLGISFQVQFYLVQNTNKYGAVSTAYFDDYDYKIETKFDAATRNVAITMTRDELDLKLIKTKYKNLFKNLKAPFSLKTLSDKTFTYIKSAYELLRWEENPANSALLKNLGSFSLTYYFLKNTLQKDYPYKSFVAAERQKVLRQFGGIKIYRDSFRVRPYGDLGNDWLKLGERAASSPAGAGQRIGDWRVGPNQIAGSTSISRINNPRLVDKSDRGALIENEYFQVLRQLITAIINEFEIDRSIVLNKFYLETQAKKEKTRKNEIKKAAEKLADQIVSQRMQGIPKPLEHNESSQTKHHQQVRRIIEKGIANLEKLEDDNAEIAQVRTLASLGLVVSSFAHELREVKNNINELDDLEKIYQIIVPLGSKQLRDYQDGLDILDSLKSDIKRISHWVEYSLTAIKKDRRKRVSLKFEDIFNSLSKQWSKVLVDRNVTLVCKPPKNTSYVLRAFEMDMYTMFSNLIANSIDAFNNLREIRNRTISITATTRLDSIQITYSDNGAGLPKVFERNVNDIFLPFVTSKKDKNGNDIGTGLGMYLVKNVVSDNNGTVEVLPAKEGFKLKITLPIRKS